MYTSLHISSLISLVYLLVVLKLKGTGKDASAKRKPVILPLLCILAGALCILYGITVMLVNSGSKFFCVWYAGGICFLLLSLFIRKNIFAKLPKAVNALLAACVSLGNLKMKRISNYLTLGGSYLLRAYEYAVNNPDTVIIVSGGQGSNEPATEASVMKEYLVSKGIDESRIIAEDKSTNTSENLQFSMALTDGLQDSSVGIVSSEFHMFRALAIAKKCGYTDTYGIPARSVRLYLPNNMLRESIGILKDLLMGNL